MLTGYYILFYKAVREAYPEIRIISSCDGSVGQLDHPTDLYDFHVNHLLFTFIIISIGLDNSLFVRQPRFYVILFVKIVRLRYAKICYIMHEGSPFTLVHISGYINPQEFSAYFLCMFCALFWWYATGYSNQFIYRGSPFRLVYISGYINLICCAVTGRPSCSMGIGELKWRGLIQVGKAPSRSHFGARVLCFLFMSAH